MMLSFLNRIPKNVRQSRDVLLLGPSRQRRSSGAVGRNKRSALRRFGRRLATNPDDGDKLWRLRPALVRRSAISLAACRKSALIFPNLWPGLLRGGAISYAPHALDVREVIEQRAQAWPWP